MAGDNSVAILGAGITGLTLAKNLDTSGARIEVFERSSRCGGWISSEQRHGFLLEHGPNTVLSGADTFSLIRDLGLENSLLKPLEAAKTRYLYSQKAGEERPSMRGAPRSLLQAALSPLLSKDSKKDILRRIVHPPRITPDISVYDFFSAHFGEEFTEDIVAAAIGGIYAADIRKLSFHAALPRISEMSGNANSLILSALIAKLRKTLAGSSSALDGKRRTLISFEEGLETLPQRIVRSLIRTHIHCNAEVSEILPEKARDGTTLYRLRVLDSQAATLKEYGPFRHILLTLPAAASSRLLEGLSGSLSKKISDIPHASIGVTHLSVAKANCSNPLEGFGMLLPPRLSKGLLGVVFSSSVFPGRAPEDRHLLTCFSGGAHFPEMARVDKNTTLNDIVAEVSNSLSLSSSPEVLSSRFLPKAIPNYSLRHGELEEEAQRFSETYPNLHLVSSWRSGIGVPERIRQANALVQQIVAEDLLS